MYTADLERRGSVQAQGGVTLVYANTTFHAVTPFGGGGYGYGHPVAVRHQQSGVEIPIRDHLMTLRLAMVGLVAMASLWRSINGR